MTLSAGKRKEEGRKSGDSEHENSFEEFCWKHGNYPEERENVMIQEKGN
jgi:hypothetical protein